MAAAVAALSPVAEHSPRRVADYRDRLDSLAADGGPTGRAAATVARRLEERH